MGATVVISGVVSKAALNGQHACVIGWNEAKCRYVIQTTDGAKMFLKPENIAEVETASDNLGTPPPVNVLKEGATVVISGVVSKPALNDQHACVIGWNEAKCRYVIRTTDGAKLFLKPENIAEVDETAGDVL
jgi:hypothetical protein